MPTYTFSFPASASGKLITIRDAEGSTVDTVAAGESAGAVSTVATNGTQGAVVVTAVLDIGDYAATAADERLFYSASATGVLDVPASLQELPDTIVAAVDASALAVAAPPTVLLRHDFAAAADTAAGGIGAPDVGPGGAWTVTGPGVASARILDGQFISPTGGVTYAYKVLATLPTVIRARNIWTGASGPVIGLMDQTVLNTTNMNGPHIQTSKTAISPFLFVGGTLGTLREPTGTPFTSPVLALADGVEYETRFDLDVANNTYRTTVTRASDGVVMGVHTAYDAALAGLLGAGPWLLFIEPGANVGYTFIEAFATSKPAVTPQVNAPAGINGPLGGDKPDAVFADRLGVGTKTPTYRAHIVGSTAADGLVVDSSHSSGGYIRVKSASGAEATFSLQRNGEADAAATVAKLRTTASGVAIAFGTTDCLMLNRSTGLLDLTPPGPTNNGRVVVRGTGTGSTASVELVSAGSSPASRLYSATAVADMRLATGGSDRIVITSAGNIGFYGVTPVARAAVAAAATDAATTQTLVNDLRSKLIALGLVS